MSEADATPRVAAGVPSLSRLLLVTIPQAIAGALLLTAVAVNMANVIGRYVFAAPLVWAEEVLSFLIIWSVYIGVGSIGYAGAHLTMDLLAAKMSSRYRAFLGLLTVVLTVACSAFVAAQTARIIALYLRTGETSMAARVPLVYAHSAVFVGFVVMGMVALLRVRAHLENQFD